MQTIEITTSPNVVCITVERAALNSDMLTRITNTLQGLIVADAVPSPPSLMESLLRLQQLSTVTPHQEPRNFTASELRRLPVHERDAILAAQTQTALQDYEVIHGGEELSESEAL